MKGPPGLSTVARSPHSERWDKRKECEMAVTKHVRNGNAVEKRPTDLFETLFSDWPAMFRRPFVVVPEGLDTIRTDEFIEDGTVVMRVEMAGIDPEKDIEISLDGDVLHVRAERREEDETKERNYTRRELRYGSFRRDLLVPTGTSEADVKASYKDGILEIRVPTTVETPPQPAVKIPISKS
jgi:HSP20 family protein